MTREKPDSDRGESIDGEFYSKWIGVRTQGVYEPAWAVAVFPDTERTATHNSADHSIVNVLESFEIALPLLVPFAIKGVSIEPSSPQWPIRLQLTENSPTTIPSPATPTVQINRAKSRLPRGWCTKLLHMSRSPQPSSRRQVN